MRSILLAVLLVLAAAVPASALTFEDLGALPGSKPVVANDSGLLVGGFNELHHRVDGGDWELFASFSPQFGDDMVGSYGLTNDRVVYAGVTYNSIDRQDYDYYSIRELATGNVVGGLNCDPLGWAYCAPMLVMQSGRQIVGNGLFESRSIGEFASTGFAAVTPALYRWVSSNPDCFFNCTSAAPVDVAASAAGVYFAYGDIQEYLSNPIGDFVRMEGDGWTDANMSHDGPVLALFDFGGVMVAGGEFSSLDGQATPGAAAWTGSTWVPLVPMFVGTPVAVKSFAIHQGVLVFVMEVTPDGEATHYELWGWDGTSATQLDANAPAGYVVATDATLYVAGPALAGGTPNLWKVNGEVIATERTSMSRLKGRFR